MNAPIIPTPARRSDRWQDEIPEKLKAALSAFALEKTQAFADLSALAEQVTIGGFSLDIDSAVINGEEWIVPGTIFVVLVYNLANNEPIKLDDSYPIELQFHMKNGDLNIDSVTADTSSFSE